jgi:hypothetical protein
MKNKLNEDIYSSDSSSMTTTSPAKTDGTTINIKKKDLSDPSVQKNLSSMKGTQVNVIDEESTETKKEVPEKLEYLSEVKDKESGEISKPFTIDGKNYQMVRAINPKKEKVLGVYSHDESSDDNHVIYSVEYFENNIVNGSLPAEKPSNDTPTPVTQNAAPMEENKPEAANFAGFKHFIVNKKLGKTRKIKNIADLAKANMSEDEEYMGVHQFKKYIDEMLFGARKKMMQEDDTPTPPNILASAQKLIDQITQKISPDVIKNIQQNTIAQREVILAFAKMIGVPANELNKIVNGLRNMQTNSQNVTTSDSSATVSTASSTNLAENKVITTIKVKDLR